MKNKILKILAVPLILVVMILPLCSWTSVSVVSTDVFNLVAPYGTSLKIGYNSRVSADLDLDNVLDFEEFISGYVYNPQNCLVSLGDNGYSYSSLGSDYVNGSLGFSLDDLSIEYINGYWSGYEEFSFSSSEGGNYPYLYSTSVNGKFDITYNGDFSPLIYMYFYHNGDFVVAQDLLLSLSTITIMEYNSYMGGWRLKTFEINDLFDLFDYGYAWDDYELDVYDLTNSILRDLYPEYDILNYRIVNVNGQFFNMSEYVTETDEYDFIHCKCYIYEETEYCKDMLKSISSYEEGYRDGINSVPETWSEVGNFLIDFLGAFTQAQIFPGVTIGGVLGIVAGGLLLLVFLKMFAGG